MTLKFHKISSEVYFNTVPPHLMDAAVEYNRTIQDLYCLRVTDARMSYDAVKAFDDSIKSQRAELRRREFAS